MITQRLAQFTLALLCALISPQFVSSQIQTSEKMDGIPSQSHSMAQQNFSTIKNFNKKGLQVTRFDSAAAAIDAHDGEIALFDGVFYLYGTSYDCGYEWGKKDAPFCGFKTYTSKDLVHWTDKGFLFDATTPIWQTRCNGSTYGCYRPHVIYNQKTRLYVLWINVYDNQVGFRVFTSVSPIGPFTEVAVPTLAVNNNAAIAGLNNGDHDTFVDDDNVAYIAYTDWRTNGTIVIEQLNEDYTSGTGIHVEYVTPGNTEAPSLIKRDGIYYLLYSDPNCGYCSGTGTSYRTATSPMGPWSEGKSISINSGGGQPSFVSMLKTETEVIYLYGSDLWNNGASNEALANYFWVPLSFAPDGTIKPILNQDTINVTIDPDTCEIEIPWDLDNTSGTEGFTTWADISRNYQRSQSFVATRSGILNEVDFMSFKTGNPNAGLKIEIFKANSSYQPIEKALYSCLVPVDSIGWAPKYIIVHPEIRVDSASRYTIVVKSDATIGAYGLEYNDLAPYPGGGATYSSTSGSSFTVEKNRTLMFKTFVQKDDLSIIINNEAERTILNYPNPVYNYLKVSLKCNTPSSILKLYETSGQEVYVKKITGIGNKNYVINMSSYKSGVYLMKFMDGKNTQTIKIIKA